jgi:hypothetical protein
MDSSATAEALEETIVFSARNSLKKFLRREFAATLSHAFRWQADKLLRVLRRFKRQTHLKSGALRTCFEVDFPEMPFDDDSVGNHESNSRT